MEWNSDGFLLPCRLLNESDSADDNLVLSFHEIVSIELSFVAFSSWRKFRGGTDSLAEFQGTVFRQGRREVMKEAVEMTIGFSWVSWHVHHHGNILPVLMKAGKDNIPLTDFFFLQIMFDVVNSYAA